MSNIENLEKQLKLAERSWQTALLMKAPRNSKAKKQAIIDLMKKNIETIEAEIASAKAGA